MNRCSTAAGQPLDENLCSTLINSIRGIVWEADPLTFRFFFVSPRAEQILGYPCRQWIDEPDFWRRHTHPDDVEWCSRFCRDASEKGEDHEFQYRMLAADGRTVWLHDIVTVARADDGSVRLRGIMFDITERIKMQDELLKAQKLESLGLLAGGIAHDFNNILTGILGNLSLARIRLDPSHHVARQIGECEKAAIRASELANQLLTFSRGGEPVKKLIDPAPLIRETVSFVLHGSNVGSVIELADDLWCLEADSGQIGQVLHNILINAAQAMPRGGELTVRAVNETVGPVNTCRLHPGNYLKIIVEDQGSGIPPENLAKIFDPYFTTRPGGSGLGLASVYSIVRRHDGAVEVSSTVGVGSSFTVHLPARPCMLPESEAAGNVAERSENGRVLVMDDEEVVRDIVKEALEFMGFDVEICNDGRQAIERFRSAREHNAPFDAVILDLTVPGGMGGREAAGHILEIDPAAVLIVSSGYSCDPVIANYRQYGFSGAVSKPFTAGRLAGELERLINTER